MVDDRKQLNVKIPSDLWDEIEKIDLLKQNIVTDAIRLYLDRDKQTENSSEVDLRSERDYLRSKLDETLKLLNQAQVLQLQTQKQLSESNKEKEVKQWWQFWKK